MHLASPEETYESSYSERGINRWGYGVQKLMHRKGTSPVFCVLVFCLCFELAFARISVQNKYVESSHSSLAETRWVYIYIYIYIYAIMN